MSILNLKENTNEAGIKKTIDSGSQAVAMDILQRGIYAYPVKSTIRELASNAYDANSERDTARKILKGIEKVEDHYDVEKIDGIHHASGWDPDYYDVDYLSSDNNVYIFYEEGVKRDTLRIRDNGVGLGTNRLVGYFKLNYSSKRSQKGALGKWGLGNKSPLSLGIDSYTVVNRYNGKKFRFEVFLDNVVSTTPKFSNGKMNQSITVSIEQPTEGEDGKTAMVDVDFTFFYEDTDEKNGLEVIIPIKKHEKKEFFRAVEEQLMYIPNVIFKHKAKDSFDYEPTDIAAKVMYRDENIVISETTLLDYPHILLGAGDGLINYGAVDFQALELEPKRGAVGLILDINTVEVTPSREAVVWSPKTRKAIIDAYNEIVETATKLINRELDSADDYLDWLIKAGSIKNALVTNASSTGTVLQKLSGIIDSSSINKIYYRKNAKKILYESDVKKMMGEHVNIRTFSYDRWQRKIDRSKIKSVNSLSGKTIYVTEGPSDKYRDRYIYEYLESHSNYIVIKLGEEWKKDELSRTVGTSKVLKVYDEISVPESIMDLYLKEEVDGSSFNDDENTTETQIDPNRLAKLRKLEQKILFHKVSVNNGFTYQSKEVKISDIMTDYANETVVYGFSSTRDTMNAMLGLFPYGILSALNDYSVPYHLRRKGDLMDEYKSILGKTFKTTPVNAMLVSKDNQKYLADKKNFKTVPEFMVKSYRYGKLVFNDNIVYSVTMKLIRDMLNKKYELGDVMNNRELVDDDLVKKFFTPEFLTLRNMANIYNSSMYGHHKLPEFYMNCVSFEMGKNAMDESTLQDYLDAIDQSLPEELCETVDEITDVHIVDTKLINEVEEFCKFYTQFSPILKTVQYESDLDILEVLYPLIKNHEEFPKETKYFQ